MRWSGILGLLLCSYLLPVQAQQVDGPGDSKRQTVAALPQWAHLLHYREHPFSLRYMSQNDDPHFFLAEHGKTSLVAELNADLDAFLQTGMADNQSAQCRFPARYFWLKKQFPELSFHDQPCSEFTAWRDELDASAITLIFPASHINSPSSMYGHTLIRLDRENEARSKLLSYAVNFAANADPTDNELVFSYKGLTGGYLGVVSVMPYYVKTNEYQHMEYRDVWEYRLNFSTQETAQFVRHIWETKDTYFDYFFFDENCSYRIVALLDASSERADLADGFRYKAVPVDTIRALEEGHLVGAVEYRPSAATELEFKSQQSSPEVLRAAKALVDSEQNIEDIIADLNDRDQVRALELSYAYARYLAIKKKQANPVLRKRTLAILSARAKRPQAAEFDAVPLPRWRDDEGHLTMRAGVRAGMVSDAQEQSGFADLKLRMAYHDVLDLPKGFVPGSQIQMGQFDVRVWDDGDIRLQKAMIVDVLSLSHRTYFQRPVAWAVTFGAERFAFQEAELYSYLKVAFGQAWLTSAGRFYGLGEIQLLADNQFEDGYQGSFGPRLGWLLQQEQIQAQAEVNWQGLTAGDDTERTLLKASLGYRLNDNQQVRFSAERQLFRLNGTGQGVNQLSAEVHWYF